MNRFTLVRTFALAAVSAAALLVTPLAAAAQDPATSAIVAPAPIVNAPPAAAPRLGPVDAPAGIVRAEAGASELAIQSAGRDNRNIVWMIIGGGMMLGGSLIGDDVGTIVSVTGLVIGLVGLYRYLR